MLLANHRTFFINSLFSAPCNPAFYLDQQAGCTPCPESSWSVGGLTESCTPCPVAQTVAASKGTCEGDCQWRE